MVPNRATHHIRTCISILAEGGILKHSWKKITLDSCYLLTKKMFNKGIVIACGLGVCKH